MNSKTILEQFKEKVSEKITLQEKGINRFLVRTPFMFEDGDYLVVILKYDSDSKEWILTDEGHTFLHLSYFMDEKDFSKGTREKIISNSKNMFRIEDKEGELYLKVRGNDFGDSLYDFVQCLLKISDITFLERERAKSTFFEDFKAAVNSIAKKEGLNTEFDHYIEERDKQKAYPIDCFIETKAEPLFVYAINNDRKCMDVTISILTFEKWSIKFHAVGIFEDQTAISRKVLAKFSDACEKQISSLDNTSRFEQYLHAHNISQNHSLE